MQMQSRQLIAGRWQDAADGTSGTSVDPADGSVIGTYAAGGVADADAAIAAARAAFERPEWAQAPRVRQLVMLQWADALEAKADELARLLTRENGKVLAQSRGEIGGSISEIRYYAGLARYIPGHVFQVEPGVFSTLIKEPAGVAGLIIPWNAPVVLLIRAITPALAAGCTVVVKPAPQTAQITAAVIGALHDVLQRHGAHFAGVVNLVSESGHAVAQRLVASRDVDVISFTGSNATGARIMAAAAPTMKKLSLELGGKSACLVFDDVVSKVATYAEVFGISTWPFMNWRNGLGRLDAPFYRGEPVDHGYLCGMGFNYRNFGFEIIQPTWGPSHYRNDFLDVVGAGVHHMQLLYPRDQQDFDEIAQWLAPLGIDVVMGSSLREGATTFYYLDSREALGGWTIEATLRHAGADPAKRIYDFVTEFGDVPVG